MWSNKKVVVLGAGESGNGAAVLAKAKGLDVFVSDSGRIKEKYRNELESEGINFEEGGHNYGKFKSADMVVKSPGISNSSKIIKQLKEDGKEVISEIEFAFRYKGESKIIAITGSNGKSTTTSLVYHLLKEAGKEVAIVGNIGLSFAKQVAQNPKEWYVIEVSSFQLDDINSFSPDIAVILNITPDHLDRYDYDFKKYVTAKFNIAKYQTKDQILILNIDDQEIKEYIEKHPLKPKIISITMNEQQINEDGAFKSEDNLHIKLEGEELTQSIHDLMIRGKHNWYNTMAAGISARAAGIRNNAIRESFATFNGLEHRLEYVATIRGVDFINDSKGTNLNSVWYALESMTKPVVLILGGQDKGNDYNEIMDLVLQKVRAIVCLGANNQTIIETFKNVLPNIVETWSAIDAVNAAYALAERGDVVLLSPGCASFDLFDDFEDRGRQFKAAVKLL